MFKGIKLKNLPIVPWDQIIYTFAKGMTGTPLSKKKISDMFLACMREDGRIQAILTKRQKKMIAKEA